MNENNIQIRCEYCKGITYNDLLGNCVACGAVREEKNMPKAEPEPELHERMRWGENDFSMVCSSSEFDFGHLMSTQGSPFATPYRYYRGPRPESPIPGEATK